MGLWVKNSENNIHTHILKLNNQLNEWQTVEARSHCLSRRLQGSMTILWDNSGHGPSKTSGNRWLPGLQT